MMSERKQQGNENNLSVAGSNKGSSSFDLIPVDLFIHILSRLSLKSITRCRCVSKQWSSTIRRPNYTLLFPIKFPAPPRLLFAFKNTQEFSFNSSPQKPNMNSSLVATPHHRISNTNFFQFCHPIRGLVCLHYIENNYSVAMVFNPSTGESLTLPKLRILEGMRPKWRNIGERYSLGFDPIDKQFKVLRITWLCNGSDKWSSSTEYQVLTIGTGNRSLIWRNIQCSTIQCPLSVSGICINGVLYYPANINNEKHMIVCFDVRFENFSFTDIDQEDLVTSISDPYTISMIDYKGKLGVCNCTIYDNLLVKLWVLEDAEEHKWSKHIYQTQMPRAASSISLAGMVSSGEIVLYPCYGPRNVQEPFFIYYYNLESGIITRVRLEVPIFKEFSYSRFFTFSDFEEDLTPI